MFLLCSHSETSLSMAAKPTTRGSGILRPRSDETSPNRASSLSLSDDGCGFCDRAIVISRLDQGLGSHGRQCFEIQTEAPAERAAKALPMAKKDRHHPFRVRCLRRYLPEELDNRAGVSAIQRVTRGVPIRSGPNDFPQSPRVRHPPASELRDYIWSVPIPGGSAGIWRPGILLKFWGNRRATPINDV